MDKTKAQRNTTWRERKRLGVLVVPVCISAETFIDAARERGILEPNDQPDRAAIGHLAGAVLELWAAEARALKESK